MIRKVTKGAAYATLFYGMPLLALADVGGSGAGATGAERFLGLLQRIFQGIIPIVTALALIYFIYGLAEYILESGDTGKKEEGRTRMIYGTIAMFVIASVWGLVGFLQRTLEIGPNTNIPLPTIKSQNYQN